MHRNQQQPPEAGWIASQPSRRSDTGLDIHQCTLLFIGSIIVRYVGVRVQSLGGLGITEKEARLEQADVEATWDACGARDLVVPGAVVGGLAVSGVRDALLQHHAQPKHKRALHLPFSNPQHQ